MQLLMQACLLWSLCQRAYSVIFNRRKANRSANHGCKLLKYPLTMILLLNDDITLNPGPLLKKILKPYSLSACTTFLRAPNNLFYGYYLYQKPYSCALSLPPRNCCKGCRVEQVFIYNCIKAGGFGRIHLQFFFLILRAFFSYKVY